METIQYVRVVGAATIPAKATGALTRAAGVVATIAIIATLKPSLTLALVLVVGVVVRVAAIAALALALVLVLVLVLGVGVGVAVAAEATLALVTRIVIVVRVVLADTSVQLDITPCGQFSRDYRRDEVGRQGL